MCLRTKSQVLTKIETSESMSDVENNISFNIFSQNLKKIERIWISSKLFKTALSCSVPSRKWPGSERIRPFRRVKDVEINIFSKILSQILEVQFLKMLQNLLKVVLSCSVPSSKRPGFDRIRDFRKQEWCWD